jgi:hypothetical protein
MKIWIYYHIAQFPGWQEMVTEKIKLMQDHGLWRAASKIVLQFHSEPEEAQQWLDTRPDITDDPRMELQLHCEIFGRVGFRPSFAPVNEVYSINEIHYDCLADEGNHAVFRLHTKGITHWGQETWETADKWNQYLEYWNILKWRLCYEALIEGFDTVGANWHNGCWSGNIWWASTKWIKQIPLLKWPHEVNFEKQLNGWSPRHDAEHWIGYTNPRYLELDHYEHAIDYRWCPDPAIYKFKPELPSS